jgi:hypothetical protein
MQLVRHIKPHVFFHECTRNFQHGLLEEYLPGYTIFSALMKPEEQGLLIGFHMFF